MQSTAKIVVHEGSSSSSKTFSIAQYHIIESFKKGSENKTFSVVRKTMPAMKRGALKDFKSALNLADCYSAFDENKTDFRFTNRQTNCAIEFFALDSEQKARGPRRDMLWCNEANELNHDDFRQLSMRTRERILIDYNPSMLRSWIYDDVLRREDVEHIHSTYKDNPYLSEANRREIEVMVPVYEDGTIDWNLEYKGTSPLVKGDPYWWSVYGLGRRGAPSEAIFPYVYDSDELPDTERVYGLDFGYNHAMVLVDIAIKDAEGRPELHIDELLHESHLTIADLIDKLPAMGVKKNQVIYADGSRPEAIEEIRRAGYWIKGADKTKGSVYSGINSVKSYKLCFTKRSSRGKAQHQDYRWKKLPDGTILDEPVKLDDDCPDAVRYALFTHFGKPRKWWAI